MKQKKLPELKPLFLERMKNLLPDKKDFEEYLEILKNGPVNSIRCNTLKISPEELKKILDEKGWKITTPWKNYPEIMIIESELGPGELGRSLEHLLGYYYVQEISSMLPIIALKPIKEELILDLCASPGSKSTQIASEMKNTGTLISNEVSLGRIKILASNLERCGVANGIITKKDGVAFCNKIAKFYPELKFDRILIDAPCSGEGTLRSSPKTYLMWNINTINYLSKIQKSMMASAIKILRKGGEIVYSTCTHAPEENEEIVDYILQNFRDEIKIEKIEFPEELKVREGVIEWDGKKYSEEAKKSCRICPQDNDTEGFFIAKCRKIK